MPKPMHDDQDVIDAANAAIDAAPDPVDVTGAVTPDGEAGDKKAKREIDWQAFNAIANDFVLIYGTTTLFHRPTRRIMTTQAAALTVSRFEYRIWLDSTRKAMVYPEAVVFDPTGLADDDADKCNLFEPLISAPKAGDVGPWLMLLDWLIGESTATKEEEDALRHWLLCWLAYPIQSLGSKHRSALIFHGDEGAGKNLLFDCYADIYGKYAATVGQDELEDKFNDWRSCKLFVIGDEVVTAQEMGHTKNRLKALVTSPTVQINPKGLPRREEKNYMNVVFLSNELKPLKLDQTDRRYVVIWTPQKRERSFYDAVGEWRDAGGAQALHHFLLNYDTKGFSVYADVPVTAAKLRLIDRGRTPAERFLADWSGGDTRYYYLPCTKEQLYAAYKGYCMKNGERNVQHQKLFSEQIARSANSQSLGIEEKQIELRGSKKTRCWVFGDRPASIATDREWVSDCVDTFGEKLGGEPL